MNVLSHDSQKDAWEREHAEPSALKQMDSTVASGGVQKFYDFLKRKNSGSFSGIEMGCGKGRNGIWLAKQEHVHTMSGFDFSQNAITEACTRAEHEGVDDKTQFVVADATQPWPYADESFDFAIDCFASSDIENRAGREFAAHEMARVVKRGGYILVYELSTDDEYHKEMLLKSPGAESGSFINPNGKFEKVFTEPELLSMYEGLKIIESEQVHKTAEFYGATYQCHHHWMIFQKRESQG